MEIIDAKYIISSPGYKNCPAPDRAEFAFIGRSNVGKSSLINMLTGKKQLAKISSTPGKTQLINHFEITSRRSHASSPGEGSVSKPLGKLSGQKRANWYLVDLPGYGYAKVSHKARNNWDNMLESYIRKRQNLVCLFVLVDSRHQPQPADLDFIYQLGSWGTPFVLVFTKADKNKPGGTERNVAEFQEALSGSWEEPPPHFVSSALKNTGRKEVLDYIERLINSFTKL